MATRRHHYIPQFYLRNFCDPDIPGKVWAYARNGKLLKGISPRDLGVEKDYHTITTSTGEKDRESIESTFAELESAAAPVIERIRLGKELSSENHFVFIVFVAQMLLRVPARRDEAAKMMRSMLEHMVTDWALDRETYLEDYRRFQTETNDSSDIDPEKIRESIMAGGYRFEIDPIAALGASVGTIETVTKFLTHFHWVFLRGHGRFEFVTCDNPVFYCDPTAPPDTWRGVGLANPGVELSFPLSPQVLAFGSYRPQRRRYQIVQPEVVRFFNQRTIDSAYRYIYAAEGSQALERFISHNCNRDSPVSPYLR